MFTVASARADTDAWPQYGGDPGSTRYSPLARINTANVAQLKQAWIFHTGDISPGGNGNCETRPFCQITGKRSVPKNVVAAVPTAIPLSFALLETAKLRLERFGNGTRPPLSVQVNA